MTKMAVVGGGFGGLATAIRLQTAGFDVEIFEKREFPGAVPTSTETRALRLTRAPPW